MENHRSGLALVVLVSLVAGCQPDAETPERAAASPAEDLAAAAISRLERALVAMGTLADLERFGAFEVRAVGTLDKNAEGQGFSPEEPSPGPYEETFVVDVATDRIAWEYREERYDGTHEAFREAYLAPEERLIVVHDPPLSIPARSRRFVQERQRVTRRIPHLALAELLASAPRVELVSGSTSPPRVLGALIDGTLLAAELDPESGLLSRLSYVARLSGRGDTEVVWWFDDYRAVEGLGLFPFRYGSSVGDRVYTELTVEAVTRGGLDRFTAPPDYRRIPEQQLDVDAEAEHEDPAPLELDELFPGIYRAPEVRGGFAPLVVAFEDHSVVVDAPASFPMLGKIPAEETDPAASFSWHSERLLEAIREALPDRPVRYVVLTHGHDDHVGGVRAFVAAGATVLAAPPVRPVVERLVALPPSQIGDRLAGMSSPGLRFEAINERRVLQDRQRRLEILPVGENPHAEGLLVVHLPIHRLLFVSDLITPEPVEVYPRPAHAALDRFLARWLANAGLDPERILSMHGATFATREHLARAEASP